MYAWSGKKKGDRICALTGPYQVLNYVAWTLQKFCRTHFGSPKDALLLEDPAYTPEDIVGESEQHKF